MLWPTLECSTIQNSSRRNWNTISINRELEEISTIRTRRITHNSEGEVGDMSVGEEGTGWGWEGKYASQISALPCSSLSFHPHPDSLSPILRPPLTLTIIHGLSCSDCWYFFKVSAHQNNIPISSRRDQNSNFVWENSELSWILF